MGGGAECTEAETHVESGLAHGTIAFVVVRAQLERFGFLTFGGGNGRGSVADLQGVGGPCNLLSCFRLGLNDVVIGLCGMQKKILRYFAVEAAFVLHSLGGRAIAENVVWRQTGLP